MEKLAENIWIVNGDAVMFLGLPFTTRMTIVKLSNNDLWVHSPIKLSPALKTQVEVLGNVKYLIAPNHLHHLFLTEWIDAYPRAQVYGTDEVIKKRGDITFKASLNSPRNGPWSADIEQELFSGSPLMQECVFYHKSSETLVVADLVENFSGDDFNAWQRVVAKGVGILAPNGKMPIDWRLSFIFGKADACVHFEKIMAWQPKTLVMAHGEIVSDNVSEFLARSFKWLQ
ncbi:DUF4336 domain-containing protein [Idiomarina xiamenensis]|uniref:DUF4336 domain-containing protein n=1 Tax=Idiomarina xiamenensis 10-D-4 TaxID=740709 RepID=K2KS95_9GAMM|nr:DUF4336 domain-containing protein [Idiomarina xiamenensis]EKE85204.1 hypothetical protein A10D4_02630 [Idiomarina xiamenensis 10-D-4]